MHINGLPVGQRDVPHGAWGVDLQGARGRTSIGRAGEAWIWPQGHHNLCRRDNPCGFENESSRIDKPLQCCDGMLADFPLLNTAMNDSGWMHKGGRR